MSQIRIRWVRSSWRIECLLGWASLRLFVAGQPDDRLGQRLVLFLENTPLSDQQWVAIQQTVRAETGPYALPRAWRNVPTFMETGKVDRWATGANE